MFDALYVAAVMPAEPAGPARVYILGHHELPAWVINTLISLHHGVHHIREPVTALQCITAVARGPRYRCQLASCLAMDRGQVISIARHLAGPREPTCNLFSFWYSHITFSHKSIGLSRSLLLVACRLLLAACRLSLASRFSIQ